MGAAKHDINDFRKRVKRIKSPRNQGYYDPNLGMQIPKRVSGAKIKKAKEEPTVLSIVLVSMILGAFALMVAQVIRIRYFGLIESSSVVTFLEIFVAFWGVMLLAAMTNKRTITERIAQIAGIAVMMVAGHNLIWRWPDQMAIIYTTAHVEQVMQTTTQHSIVYRGSVFGL